MGKVRLPAGLKRHQSNVTQNISGFLGHYLFRKGKTLRNYCSLVLVADSEILQVQKAVTLCVGQQVAMVPGLARDGELRIHLNNELQKLGAVEVQKEISFVFLEDFCRSPRRNHKYFEVTVPYVYGFQ